jgi:hypothetical protein
VQTIAERLHVDVDLGSAVHPFDSWTEVALRTLEQSGIIAQKPNPHVTDVRSTRDVQREKEAIRRVMDQFHSDIVTHHGEELSGLFLPEATIWLNELTDSAYEQAHAKSPEIAKVRVSSYRDFAKFVSTTHKALDPEHLEVVIHTDGTIAAVYFDFVFKIDGEVENHGSETWQLLKAVDGWRIAAISYSSQPGQ